MFNEFISDSHSLGEPAVAIGCLAVAVALGVLALAAYDAIRLIGRDDRPVLVVQAPRYTALGLKLVEQYARIEQLKGSVEWAEMNDADALAAANRTLLRLAELEAERLERACFAEQQARTAELAIG